jgi:hypothetical protein
MLCQTDSYRFTLLPTFIAATGRDKVKNCVEKGGAIFNRRGHYKTNFST